MVLKLLDDDLDDDDVLFNDNFDADKLLRYIEKNEYKIKESQKEIKTMFENLEK